MRFISILIFIILLQFSNSKSQIWKSVNDTNIRPAIHKIYFPTNDTNKIYIASDNVPMNLMEKEVQFWDYYPTINGVGYQLSTDKGETFTGRFLDGYFVYEFAQSNTNPDLWLASVRDNGSGGLIISNDNAETWKINDWRSKGTYQILKIVSNLQTPERFFASAINTADGFRTSNDDFLTFRTNTEIRISSRDINISPLNDSLLYLAGDKLNQGGVFISTDNGTTWKESRKGIENLRIHTVVPSAYSSDIIVCGADSILSNGSVKGKGIYVSEDAGDTWNHVAATNSSVFQIVRHPSNSRYMAAACGEDGVWLSGSWGTGWEHFQDGFPDTASIRCVGIPDWSTTNDGIVVYAGTYSSGLYVSEGVKTSVEEQTNNFSKIGVLNVAPTPFENDVKITWFNPEFQKVSISIKDFQGNTIYSFPYRTYLKGINTTYWQTTNKLANGTLFVVLSNGINTVSSKLLLNR